MLRPADRGGSGGTPDRSIGDLAQQVLEDGKDYLRAEANLLRVKAEAEIGRYRKPAILAATTVVAALAALVALAVAVVIVLAWAIGVTLGAILAVLLFMAIAAGSAYATRNAFRQAGKRAGD
ncbi:MAG TPA: phage holin family protein [Sphingomicrobium sp.]|nr:phage holin family protein [Sphingomicrobium sp.]